MRNALLFLAFMGVVGLAFWAYKENYRTKAAIDEMTAVRQNIAGLRETLGVLRAEWAYLNRPDRLQELANINFDKLQLLPFESAQFAAVAQIARPLPPAERVQADAADSVALDEEVSQ